MTASIYLSCAVTFKWCISGYDQGGYGNDQGGGYMNQQPGFGSPGPQSQEKKVFGWCHILDIHLYFK